MLTRINRLAISIEYLELAAGPAENETAKNSMNPLMLKRADRALWPAAVTAAWAGKRVMHRKARPRQRRPLVVRPGGIGDLILLCVAIEHLGYEPNEFIWVIEKRSRVWADHLELDYYCYDDETLE